MGGEEEERGEESEGAAPLPPPPPPPAKKRSLALTAFVLCLAFLLYIVDMCISFILKLAESDKAWTNYETVVNAKVQQQQQQQQEDALGEDM